MKFFENILEFIVGIASLVVGGILGLVTLLLPAVLILGLPAALVAIIWMLVT